MKQILKLTACVFSVGLLTFISCQKELSCYDCSSNKPPIAVAGADQKITLPKDSVALDGTASTDPDGTITSYKWTKISGHVSSNISKPDSSKTLIKTLVMGVYKFELTVTDNGGLTAKDTVQIIVNDPAQPNRPPVAIAGADQTITLPTSTVTLDGSGSTDPDNNITSYVWTKISGPSSFTIVNTSAVQTQVTNLVQGIYQFELKVTDAGGLFSKDTIQAIVIDQPPPPQACDNSNRPQVNAQLISIGALSFARAGMTAVAAGNKILFAGSFLTYISGPGPAYASTRVDIYDIVTQSWSTAELSVARFGIAAVAAGNKIFFAGGENGDGAWNTVYANVDIYDVSTNTWSVASLSEPRSYIAAAVIGNKVFFAGGEINDSETSNKVDIYDLPTNTWSTAVLSEARAGISPVSVNNKIYFAGGHVTNYWIYIPSNRIDIYDNTTNSWSTSSLTTLTGDLAGTTVADKIYWARECKLEIKDINTWNSSVDSLYKPGGWTINDGQNAVIKNNKLVFFRHAGGETNKFDIYDLATNSWSIGVLSTNNFEYSSIISFNNTIYIAGGWVVNSTSFSNQVWRLEF